jgi:hypothetical protein
LSLLVGIGALSGEDSGGSIPGSNKAEIHNVTMDTVDKMILVTTKHHHHPLLLEHHCHHKDET